MAYYNNADEIGTVPEWKIAGNKTWGADDLHVTWQVAEPGY